jgi:hypothetical protein
VESSANGNTKKSRKHPPGTYKVLRQAENNSWQDLGIMNAYGVDDARHVAIEEYGLAEEAARGEVVLVAFAERFWQPKRSVIENRRPKITFSR